MNLIFLSVALIFWQAYTFLLLHNLQYKEVNYYQDIYPLRHNTDSPYADFPKDIKHEMSNFRESTIMVRKTVIFSRKWSFYKITDRGSSTRLKQKPAGMR
jgi:hypothetical protein